MSERTLTERLRDEAVHSVDEHAAMLREAADRIEELVSDRRSIDLWSAERIEYIRELESAREQDRATLARALEGLHAALERHSVQCGHQPAGYRLGVLHAAERVQALLSGSFIVGCNSINQAAALAPQADAEREGG